MRDACDAYVNEFFQSRAGRTMPSRPSEYAVSNEALTMLRYLTRQASDERGDQELGVRPLARHASHWRLSRCPMGHSSMLRSKGSKCVATVSGSVPCARA